MNFIKLQDVKVFQIVSHEKTQYKKWDETVKNEKSGKMGKYLTSETPQKGFSKGYTFKALIISANGQADNAQSEELLELSASQFQQILLAQFDLKKDYTTIQFEVTVSKRTDGKNNYWINPLRLPNSQPYAGMGDNVKNTPNSPLTSNSGLVGYPTERTEQEEVNPDAIPF